MNNNRASLPETLIPSPAFPDEDMHDDIWFYCPCCDEEYRLPEFATTCPVCLLRELEEL